MHPLFFASASILIKKAQLIVFLQNGLAYCVNFLFQFGDDFHFDIVSYMLHMHVKSNWQNGVIQMIPPVQVLHYSTKFDRFFETIILGAEPWWLSGLERQ